MRLTKAYFLIVLVLLIDQFSKIFVKTNFILGEEVSVFSWFKILFIQDEIINISLIEYYKNEISWFGKIEFRYFIKCCFLT